MSEKESYEKKLQAQLNEWSAEIDKLKAKADKAEAGAEIELHKRVKELRAKQSTADKKLKELKNASDDAWKDMKVGIESARNSLGSALRAAASEFR